MKTKTNRTLRKILSMALCLALVISFVPMVVFAADDATNTVTDFSVTEFGLSDGLYGGWRGNTEEDLDGSATIINSTEDEGKTAWEDGDQIIATLTSQKYGTQTVALIFDALSYSWAADGYFRYAEGETPDISAIYAPCYERTTDGSLQLKDGMQLGMTEYIEADCSIVDGAISISFDNATRDYSRLRIVGLPNQELTVTTTEFTPAGSTLEAPHEWCTLTTDEKGNAYLYGTFAEGATIVVKQGDVTLAEYAFSSIIYPEGTEKGKSYVLDTSPTIIGTYGGQIEATEEDITALVEQLKYYVDNGITTIIVTGDTRVTIDMGSYTNTAIGEAIYRLSGNGYYYDENNPYNGKIDLILRDVTEIVDQEFYGAFALNSITLPKVTKLGDQAFYDTRYLRTITFGSVLTEVVESGGVMFHRVGENVGGCDLVLNCGQMSESGVPTPDLTTNTWKITYENEFKSITLTHTKLTSANCIRLAVCELCGASYGEVDADNHNYRAWTSNGDGTHTRTCSYDNTHTESVSCFGGMATCTKKAVCAICKTAYGDMADHSTTADGDRAATCNELAYCSVCESEYGDVDLTKHDDAMEYENGLCPNGCYQTATQNEYGYYEIGNAGQLMWFAQLVNNGETSANAILMADIDMDGIGTWSIMQTYDGTLDGNGYTIQGLNQNAGLGDGEQQGFIRCLTGTVKNTTFKNCSAFQQDSLGCAIIAYNNSGTISGCMVVGCNVQLGNYGGLALVTGRNLSGGVIKNCGVVGGNITRRFSGVNNQGMAAITEQNGGTVQNCFAYGFNLNSNDSKLGALVYSGNAPVNSYYYYSGDKVFDSAVESIAKTAEQFASGEVAHLLQQGNTEQIWGQDSNQAGATPILDSTGIYNVVEIGETGTYSVSNVGDTNGNGTVDVTDYQALVNVAISDGHNQSETAGYDDIVKYDLNGDGYIDVLDASLMSLFINGFKAIPVYAVGDYDLNGVAFEEADLKAIKHAVENPETLATYKKYACDINSDGKVDAEDTTLLADIYGEITGTECADNVNVYYRWGNKYSTCTATAMCTLCGDVYETGIAEVYSTITVDPTCTQEGSMFCEAYFENPDLFEPQYVEVDVENLPHDLSDGICTVCGLIDAIAMTAE